MSNPRVWFITGSSRGFGRALTTAAIESGDFVVASARNPNQLSELADVYGDRILPPTLDVTDAAAAQTAVEVGRDTFGKIDVLVNNAGYANLAPIETGRERVSVVNSKLTSGVFITCLGQSFLR